MNFYLLGFTLQTNQDDTRPEPQFQSVGGSLSRADSAQTITLLTQSYWADRGRTTAETGQRTSRGSSAAQWRDDWRQVAGRVETPGEGGKKKQPGSERTRPGVKDGGGRCEKWTWQEAPRQRGRPWPQRSAVSRLVSAGLPARAAVPLTLKCTMASTAFAFRFSRSFCFTWWIMTNYSRIIVDCVVLLPCKPAFAPRPTARSKYENGLHTRRRIGKKKQNRLLLSNYLSRY